MHLAMAKNGRPSGEAYVIFATVEDAERAVLKDKEKMGTRWLDVYPATKGEVYAQQNTQAARGGPAGAATGAPKGTGANLMKEEAKRRRSKKQIEEDKQEEGRSSSRYNP